MNRQEILSYMRQQNWWPKFVTNFDADFDACDQYGTEEFEDYLQECHIHDVIGDAFEWCESPEGSSFWSIISEKINSL